MLPIPENYYDDLEAKIDIDPALLANLQAHNVLYDRDDTGEYFQMYTRTFDERFFFEVVQRRGGYKGFGAPNAQVRLTAQARLARAPGVPRR
jgi:4-hydroxyphenylpyruvate dioxygenase